MKNTITKENILILWKFFFKQFIYNIIFADNLPVTNAVPS